MKTTLGMQMGRADKRLWIMTIMQQQQEQQQQEEEEEEEETGWMTWTGHRTLIAYLLAQTGEALALSLLMWAVRA